MRTPNLLGKNGIGAGKQIMTKRLIAVLLMLMCCTLVFAQNNNANADTSALSQTITNWSGKITSFLSSGWIKAVALIALVAEAIGIVVGGQQGGGSQVFRKLAPWIIGTIILLMASGICSYMYDSTMSFSLGNS